MAWFKSLVTRWLRLPSDPQAPAGSEGSARVFRAATNYYRYALARWGLRQAGVLFGVFFVLVVWQPLQDMMRFEMSTEVVDQIRDRAALLSWAERLHLAETQPVQGDPGRVVVSFGPALFWLELFGITFVIAQIPFTFAMVQLDFEKRWYIVTDRSLRIREGLTSLRESTMTFANIQNLSIVQGPIQRLLGIADLKVRTAGGGSSGEEDSSEGEKSESMHIGYFRGVDNAAELRDTILAHLQRLRSAGLGDAAPSALATRTGNALEAARSVLAEARAIRAAIERS